MGAFKNIFTWWEGATFGTWFNTKRTGAEMGKDELGNVYYQANRAEQGRVRRWVMYTGSNDSSRIPPEWYSWLHHQIADVPERALPSRREWEATPTPNLTGTDAAYRPAGANGTGSSRARVTGDYQAWSPDAS
jgi:NADH:ubiquinone oxidoreductase subunit